MRRMMSWLNRRHVLILRSLQLATCLYRDHLLEDDHYLDWILRNLDACPSERLFLWLMVASVYESDLTASRRRGKRFAESILDHVEKVSATHGHENRSDSR